MATRLHRSMTFIFLLLTGSTAVAVDDTTVRMATTTSARSSGLLEVLVPAFEQSSGYKMELRVVGTGRAMRMGRLGEVDVILVNAPAAEQLFVADGWGVERRFIMKNDFILVGPGADPAGIRGMRNAGEALKRIAETESMFVSRADDSGTHKKELDCWSSMNIQPAGNWYFEAGLPMGDTLKLASEKQSYTLVDRGTWINVRKHTRLVEDERRQDVSHGSGFPPGDPGRRSLDATFDRGAVVRKQRAPLAEPTLGSPVKKPRILGVIATTLKRGVRIRRRGCCGRPTNAHTPATGHCFETATAPARICAVPRPSLPRNRPA